LHMTDSTLMKIALLIVFASLVGCADGDGHSDTDGGADAATDCTALSGAACLEAGCVLFQCQEDAFCRPVGAEPCGICPSLNGCHARNTDECATHHASVESCEAAGCAYFDCAFGGNGGCFADDEEVVTPPCAVCPETYGACEGCEQHDRDAAACAASELGCRMYEDCGGACIDLTLAPCEACPAVAGCGVENDPDCAAEHGDGEGCTSVGHCAYYVCGFLGTGACFTYGMDGCAICPEVYCD
jgi:hypothetical protein